ncbi:MAG TPA: ATP-binding cassette domain-containing protein [Gammaproteobacteria bacterium]|nr:ATP-binding cassette domain-containing protein [Gammaproteobacteria bacterium]
MSLRAPGPSVEARQISKSFERKTGERVQALEAVSLEVRAGTLTALVGPDGAGKTTLIRLAAGLIAPDAGRIEVLGLDAAAASQAVQERIGYMPQKFGLYEDLSVQENLDLYADLHGIGRAERRRRYPELMEMTALGPFTKRLAGKLSGGMKQKLGLACTLVRSPELLLLDEPTVGVDPLSRRELWEIVLRLVNDERLTVLLSTSYLDEAERCEHTVLLHGGRVIADGPPAEITRAAADLTFLAAPAEGQTARSLQARLLGARGVIDAVPAAGRVRFVLAPSARGSGPAVEGVAEEPRSNAGVLAELPIQPAAPLFENGFMVLLHASLGHRREAPALPGNRPVEQRIGALPSGPAVEVSTLVRKFGDFTAVDHLSFEVERGEVFGLLGPNGAGKTTTFRMLCGLLPATSGSLRVAGANLRTSRASARQHIGYVAQKFSLYGTLTVRENLDFFSRAYGLRGRRKAERVDWALQEFELGPFIGLPSGQLPGGFKQRLAMAAALLHEPEILFLDEPTSGADPMARREFWVRITYLAQRGVTVVVTTHFMEEAEYCDRILILDSGQVLAEGTPAQIRSHALAAPGREPGMEDAFIAIVEEARSRPSLRAAGGAP